MWKQKWATFEGKIIVMIILKRVKEKNSLWMVKEIWWIVMEACQWSIWKGREMIKISSQFFLGLHFFVAEQLVIFLLSYHRVISMLRLLSKCKNETDHVGKETKNFFHMNNRHIKQKWHGWKEIWNNTAIKKWGHAFFSMLGNCFLVKHDLGLEEDWEAGAFFLFRVEVFFFLRQ